MRVFLIHASGLITLTFTLFCRADGSCEGQDGSSVLRSPWSNAKDLIINPGVGTVWAWRCASQQLGLQQQSPAEHLELVFCPVAMPVLPETAALCALCAFMVRLKMLRLRSPPSHPPPQPCLACAGGSVTTLRVRWPRRRHKGMRGAAVHSNSQQIHWTSAVSSESHLCGDGPSAGVAGVLRCFVRNCSCSALLHATPCPAIDTFPAPPSHSCTCPLLLVHLLYIARTTRSLHRQPRRS